MNLQRSFAAVALLAALNVAAEPITEAQTTYQEPAVDKLPARTVTVAVTSDGLVKLSAPGAKSVQETCNPYIEKNMVELVQTHKFIREVAYDAVGMNTPQVISELKGSLSKMLNAQQFVLEQCQKTASSEPREDYLKNYAYILTLKAEVSALKPTPQ